MQSTDVVPYLQSITGQGILTGQHLPEYQDANDSYAELIAPLPKVPAMLGTTILVGSQDTTAYRASQIAVISQHLNSGGIAVLDIHPPDPWSSTQTISSAWVSNAFGSKHDLTLLLPSAPASTAKSRWAAMKTSMAQFLQALPKGSPIVFRPLHEVSNLTFWWSMDYTNPTRSATGYRALWADLISYIRQQCPGVLIGWSTGMSWYTSLDYARPPAGQYDLAGASLYTDNLLFPNKFNDDYQTLLAAGVPVLLFEAGPNQQDGTASWDATQLTAGLHAQYPNIVGFQAWQDSPNPLALASFTNGGQAMLDPHAINLDTLAPPAPTPDTWIAQDTTGKVLGCAGTSAKATQLWPGAAVNGFVRQ
jgi:hypothetical protein